MRGFKIRTVPFLPAIIYGLVYYYGYQSYQGKFGEGKVAYGYIYLFFFLIPVIIAYFVSALLNLAKFLDGPYFFRHKERIGHLYRLYFLMLVFCIIFGIANFGLLIMPYGSQKDYSIENFNPLMAILVPLAFLFLGIAGNLFYWELENNPPDV